MVALKLLLQSLAGVVALGGAVGGTVALTNNNQETNDFYLVSSDIDISDTLQSTDLFSDTNETEKNYECLYNSEKQEKNTEGNSCILFSLNPSTNTSLKTSEIQSFIKNTSQTSDLISKVMKQEELKNNKFFLLQANKNLNKSWTTNKELLVFLTTKNLTTANNESNPFAMLQIHAKISSNEVIGKTNTIIAKATTDQQTSTNSNNSSSPTYKCLFKTNSQEQDCALSKLSSYTPGNEFNFSTSQIKHSFSKEITEKDSYYLIQSRDIIPHEVKDLNATTVTYIETQTQNSATTTTLNIEAAVFAKFNSSDTTITELIIND